jgi:prolyl 4-hydroxylase
LPHHDFIPRELELVQGPRILTVLLYLNTVEEGGETDFPTLGVRVRPKVGRCLIFPNVLNENPEQIDPRTIHQALRVKTGIKYGANAWFHLRTKTDAPLIRHRAGGEEEDRTDDLSF